MAKGPMSNIPTPFRLDPDQQFEHLARSPLVEAVIELRARAQSNWDEKRIIPEFRKRVSEYPQVDSRRGFAMKTQFQLPASAGAGAVAAPTFVPEEPATTWLGLRARTADDKQIVTATRDGFVLSRLHPYQSWESLLQEAMRLWEIHVEMAGPTAVDRIGLRYINRLVVPARDLDFSEYFTSMAPATCGLPTAHFLYKEVLGVPGYPYLANVTRTFQPPETVPPDSLSLLLDIDVHYPESEPLDTARLSHQLAEMHTLKNQLFFSSVSEKALELCR